MTELGVLALLEELLDAPGDIHVGMGGKKELDILGFSLEEEERLLDTDNLAMEVWTS